MIHGRQQIFSTAAHASIFRSDFKAAESGGSSTLERLRCCDDKGRHETSGRARHLPVLYLHKSGRRLYVEMAFAIVKGDIENEVLGAVDVARDVTERVERERAVST